MEYAKLGNTDIEVSKLCVDCMSFGKPGTLHDWTLDEARTEEIVKHALELGINFFDTANGYSDGTSEEYLGNALRKNVSRDKVVIASKVYFNPGRLSSEAIHREIEGSLKRLGTDYLIWWYPEKYGRSERQPCTDTSSIICSLPPGITGGHSLWLWRIITIFFTGKTSVS